MREEHPNQQELPDLPAGGPAPLVGGSADLAEMSEVAKLQAEVLPLGLVREGRPVFVYDAKLARERSGNAARQARLREKRAAQGLVMAQIPSEIAQALKTAGGDWSKLLKSDVGTAGGRPSPPQTPVAPGGKGDPIPEPKIVTKEVVREVRVEVPGKPVLKLTSEQKRVYELGRRAAALRGWRAAALEWLLPPPR